ncbi:MAG: hypothetical protein J6K05_00940 [Bacteroidaceae bacterium]|nr:hypothetical protein [Bacteroidaceae bacterium]
MLKIPFVSIFMLRFFFVWILCVLMSVELCAQSVDEIKADETLYLWGEGNGDSQREAKENALHDLSSKISVHVSSVDQGYMSNEQRNEEVDTYVSFERKMQTYSTVTLTDCHSKLLSSSKPYKVFTYIEREKVDKMFDDRVKVMQANVQTANNAFLSLNLADALRYYYASYLLTQSLRYRADAVVADENGKEQMAMVWIPKRIEDILSNVKVTIKGESGNADNSYLLGFFYKGEPVQKIGYTYWDGDDVRERVSYAQDGLGLVELEPSFSVKDVKVLIEYKYLSLVNRNNAELTAVYDALAEDVNFQGMCGVRVKQSKVGDDSSSYEGQALNQMSKKQENSINELSETRSKNNPIAEDKALQYAETLNLVIQAIKSKRYDQVSPLCTEDGAKAFTQLIKYGKARVVGNPTITFTEYNGAIYGRSVPMEFSFSGGNRFMENVVFTFTTDGKIDNITFGLGFKAENDIFCNMKDEEQAPARAAISNFLENYKTAYALGRFDYLDMIFSDDAFIVTGKEVRKMVGNEEQGYRMVKKVVKTKQSKNQFLANLKNAFDSKEFVNIQFVNNYIQPSRRSIQNGHAVYGIQIRQDYFSNNYKDQGYLFLRVDVTDPDAPIVSVRVWQEMPDEEEGIADLSNWQNFFKDM